MQINLFKLCGIFLSLYVAIFAYSVHAQQTISVTVDNSGFDIPETPVIVRSENVTTSTLNLVVDVNDIYAGEMIDFVVTKKNTFSGVETTQSFHQSVNGSARTTLGVNDLISGTEYLFTVRYSRDSLNVFSANSAPHTVVTAIDPPVLDSINNITTDSVNLNVVVNPVFVGSPMDFIVEVKNKNTNDTYTVKITKNVTSSSVGLTISDLDMGANYDFVVKYAREGTNNYSAYSNMRSAITDLDPPSIDNIDNITTNSVDLQVAVDSSFGGESADFRVEITNVSTGAKTTISVTKSVGSGGSVTLTIPNLNPGTSYSFRVQYKREGNTDYSDYSGSKTATTSYPDDNGKVDVCHNGHTVSVARSSLPTHLGHGDTEGPCVESIVDTGGGTTPDDIIGGVVSGGSVPVDAEAEMKAQEKAMIKEELRETIMPKASEKFYETAVALGATAGAIASLAGSAVPLFAAMPGAFSSSIFLKIIELFGIIGRRKEERNWGVVFDKVTRMPIPATKILLTDEAGNELATTYSDKDGRFGFLVNPGKYLMQVFKKDYEMISDMSADELYGNVYTGEAIKIDADHMVLSNIAMKSLTMDWAKYAEKKVRQYKSSFSVFKRLLFTAVYVVGFCATAVITYFQPTLFNWVVLSIYILMFAYQLFGKKKKYGVIETSNKNPIPFAIVSLHDKDSTEKKHFAVTDAIGRYYLLANNGPYNMKVKGQPVSGTSFEKQGDIHVSEGIVRKDITI